MIRGIVPMSGSEQMRVLMLAYYFPPMGGSGVQRSAKFAKYLPRYDWKPYVVTARQGFDLSRDQSLLEDLPKGIAIHRVGLLEFSRIRTLLRRRVRRRQENLLRCRDSSRSSGSGRAGMLDGFKRGVSRAIMPDGEVFWAASAFWKGLSLVGKQRLSIIYSSAPPYSSHLAAIALGKRTKRPVVVDFRDPWVDRAFYPWGPRRKAVEHRLEQYVLKHADAVICNHSPMRDYFLKAMPNEPASKFIVITNGFDEVDFSYYRELSERQRSSSMIFSHVGQLYPGTTVPLVSAVERLLQHDPALAGKVKVRLVGGLPMPTEDSLHLARSSAKALIELLPRVDHATSIREMFAADVLVLLLTAGGLGQRWYPGKLFEYLRVGRPILAIVPEEGIAADLVRQFEAGLVADPEDGEAILQGIQAFLDGKVSAAKHASPEALYYPYRRDVLAGQLAGVFSRLIGQEFASSGQVHATFWNDAQET